MSVLPLFGPVLRGTCLQQKSRNVFQTQERNCSDYESASVLRRNVTLAYGDFFDDSPQGVICRGVIIDRNPKFYYWKREILIRSGSANALIAAAIRLRGGRKPLENPARLLRSAPESS